MIFYSEKITQNTSKVKPELLPKGGPRGFLSFPRGLRNYANKLFSMVFLLIAIFSCTHRRNFGFSSKLLGVSFSYGLINVLHAFMFSFY